MLFVFFSWFGDNKIFCGFFFLGFKFIFFSFREDGDNIVFGSMAEVGCKEYFDLFI